MVCFISHNKTLSARCYTANARSVFRGSSRAASVDYQCSSSMVQLVTAFYSNDSIAGPPRSVGCGLDSHHGVFLATKGQGRSANQGVNCTKLTLGLPEDFLQ